MLITLPVQPLSGEIPLVNRGILGAGWPPKLYHWPLSWSHSTRVRLVCPCLGIAFSLGTYLLGTTLMRLGMAENERSRPLCLRIHS